MRPYSLLLLLTVFLAAAATCDAAAAVSVFKQFPLMQCSACESMAKEIGRRMNITAFNNRNTKILKGHRVEDHAKGSRSIDYESSEVRAVEVLEILCQDVANKHYLAQTPNGARVFASDRATFPNSAQLYSEEEARNTELTNPKARLMDFCEEILERYEDLIIRVIRTKRTMDEVGSAMCVYGLKFCDHDMMSSWLQRENLKLKTFEKARDSNPKWAKSLGKVDNSWVPSGLRKADLRDLPDAQGL